MQYVRFLGVDDRVGCWLTNRQIQSWNFWIGRDDSLKFLGKSSKTTQKFLGKSSKTPQKFLGKSSKSRRFISVPYVVYHRYHGA